MQKRSNTLYFEIRTKRMFGPSTPIASDIARHLQSRQYLGLTIVVCENPFSMLSATRKQWLKITRTIQKQRASTLNAEEILRLTQTIMHMQHLHFIADAPMPRAGAHIFFVTPQELIFVPNGCVSLYITTPLSNREQLATWTHSMDNEGLVIDYSGELQLNKLGLEPKNIIEENARQSWEDLKKFMLTRGVNASELINGTNVNPVAVDRALESLLNSGNEFLRQAANFQHTLSLAQPLLYANAEQGKQIEAVMRLAHRVHTLTPGTFSDYLTSTFGSTGGSFFLRDASVEEMPQNILQILPTPCVQFSAL